MCDRPTSFCQGDTVVYSDGRTENCNAFDGFTCNADTREFRDYFCSLGSCQYSTSQQFNCNSLDTTGQTEFFCSNNERRSRQKLDDYSCVQNNCQLVDTSFTNNTLLESCSSGCTESSIKVQTKDIQGTPLPDSSIFLNNKLLGKTNSNGELIAKTAENACGQEFQVTATTSQNKPCREKSVSFAKSDRQKLLIFYCPFEREKLSLNLSGDTSFFIGDEIVYLLNVTNPSGQAVDNATVTVFNPITRSKTTIPISFGSGVYKFQIPKNTKVGPYIFEFQASKHLHLRDKQAKTINIKNFSNLEVSLSTPDFKKISNADVYVNNIFSGKTNTNGLITVPVTDGTHNVKVCYQNICQEKSVFITSSKAVYSLPFTCTNCSTSSTLQVRLRTSQNHPLANVSIFVDGEWKALTNSFGLAVVRGISFGTHDVIIAGEVRNSGSLDGVHAILKEINFQNKVEHIDETITFSASTKISDLSSSEIQSQSPALVRYLPVIIEGIGKIAAIVMPIIDAASLTIGADDLCRCIYRENSEATILGGVQGCIKVMTQCSGDKFQSCVDKIAPSLGPVADKCPIEASMLALDLRTPGVGTTIGAKLVSPVGDPLRLMLIEPAKKVISKAADNSIVKYLSEGFAKAATWLNDLFRFEKKVDWFNSILKTGKTMNFGKIKRIKDLPNLEIKLIKGNTQKGLMHIIRRHINGIDLLKKDFTAFFPLGQKIEVIKNGKVVNGITLPTTMAKENIPELIEETIKLAKEGKVKIGKVVDGESLKSRIVLRNESVGKYGIDKMDVVINTVTGEVVTAFPCEGPAVTMWDNLFNNGQGRFIKAACSLLD